ncbi:apolipoprotein D isoform X2 [Drosophila sulfurigaster albostrigata]|uniref:apolipoprotein D isoform X2 n=1 Tax=Drosophila sulfurigaster albostrigata TaxID=89887 RepID=UPI002D21B8C3|nr:apolipoprotein D isoform X2 [Drosophila sulfurigaster albostrigata]
MQHQSLSTSIGLVMFVVFSTVFAQVPFPGQCPEVKIMDTFDLDAYMGIWYEHSKYPFAFEIGKKCIYANYENVDNSTVSVVNAAINRFTGNPTNVTGTAKVLAPAQLAVTFSKNQVANKANYLVLGTDYKSYAVVYSCTALTPLAHLKLVWILTREREATTATIDDAHKILDDNKISQTVLINTLQKNCPQLEGNATDAALLQLDENEFDGNALNEAIERA